MNPPFRSVRQSSGTGTYAQLCISAHSCLWPDDHGWLVADELSKPGFGIVSECIVNCKPLIYADRADFVEYPILVQGIRRYLRHLHIPSDRLYQGDLEEFLAAIWFQPDPPELLRTGGAEIAANRILSFARD